MFYFFKKVYANYNHQLLFPFPLSGPWPLCLGSTTPTPPTPSHIPSFFQEPGWDLATLLLNIPQWLPRSV